MKAKILPFLALLFTFYSSFAQTAESVIAVPTDPYHTYQALLYMPDDYATTTTKYSLLVFLHGVGEGTAPLSNIYNSASAGGPAYFIEHAQWPSSFTCPSDGKQYKFIVVSPQAVGSGWSTMGAQLNSIIQYLVATYRVDVNRIYTTGLSAGGAGIVSYSSHIDNQTGNPFTPKYKIAAFVPMSEANGTPSQSVANTIVGDGTRGWGFGDPVNDVHGANTQILINLMNVAQPGIARFTSYTGGHCCWGTYYNPTYRETIGGKSMDIYEWMLQYTSTNAAVTTPTASAGPNQTITLPTSSVTLSGSGTAGTGHSIGSYSWSKVSGPGTSVITNASSASTTVTGLSQGTYDFKITVKQEDGQLASSDVTITVNAAPVPVANAGSNQTITLPVSSVSLNASASTGTITSYAWTLVTGPNTPIIASPSSVSSNVTGLVQGTYIFMISLNGGTATATLKVTVNAAVAPPPVVPPVVPPPPPAPVASAGSNQTISLPTSSITLSASGSTGTISSYAWSLVSGPNTPSIASPTTVSSTVTGLVQGMYTFKVSLNGGTATSTVTVVVNAAAVTPPASACNGKKYYLDPGYANGVTVGLDPGDLDPTVYHPGDTIVFRASETYGQIEFHNLTGSSTCPITITNEGGQVLMTSTRLYDSKYIHWTGTGTSGVEYGFKVQYDPVNIVGGVGVTFEGRSKSVEYDHIDIHNVLQGIYGHSDGGCIDSLNYPNWIQDSLIVHHLRIIGTKHEGMYIGNTAPDNSATSYSPRPVVCNGVTVYPRPMRTGYVHVYDCILDLTGRGAIQVASASGGETEINNNTITRSGMCGMVNQGTGISIGTYTHAYIHDNTVSNTGTWGIASLGGSGTNKLVRIENNHIDSSGFLYTYNDPNDLLTEITPTTPLHAPGSLGDVSFVNSIFLKTAPTEEVDSTRFWIKNNKMGICQRQYAIEIQDGSHTVQKTGNVICHNTKLDGVTAVTMNVDPTVNYTDDCTNPLAFAGNNQTITLPVSSVSLTGTGTASSGFTIKTYSWSKISGGAAVIVSPATAATNITGLAQGVYVFQLLVTQSDGETATSDVTITVNAATVNRLPISNAGSNQTITLPANSVILKGTGTDADGTIASYAWMQILGPSTSLIAAPGQAQTSVNNLVQGVYMFKLTVTDNSGGTASSTVTITVNAPAPPVNIPPVASAGADQNITLPVNSVNLDGSSSKDPDGSISTYLWTKIGGPSQFTIGTANSSKTAITNMAAGVYSFQLKVTDNQGATSLDTVKVIVNAAVVNQPPVANAGADITITLPTNTANLNAGGSTDPDGSISSYAWSQLSGPSTAVIGSITNSSTSVSSLIKGVYVFVVKVTDNKGATDVDSVKVTVNPAPVANQSPIANAGTAKTITQPANSINLNGSLSADPDGTITAYKWSQVSGPSTAGIISSTSSISTATGLIVGTYVFQLIVTDNLGATGTATVKMTVVAPTAAPQPPVANAGSYQWITLPTNSVVIDGSGSTAPAGSIVSYVWSEKSGPSTVTLTNAAKNTVVNLQAGVYVFILTVTDNNGAKDSDSVVVTVYHAVNKPPVADAGPSINLTLPTNSTVLDGTKSNDPDGTISSYSWTLISGPNTPVVSGSTTAKLNVSGMIVGQYIYQLTVTDNSGATASAQVKIKVAAAANVPPIANAGVNQSITAPKNSINLDGTASYDPDGTITKYSWVTVSGPGTITIINSGNAIPTVTGLQVGAYTFRLTVTDNTGATAQDEVTVIVNPQPVTPNQNPVANAGNNLTITLPVNSIALNGSSSYDPDGTISAFSWKQISGPTTAIITGGTISDPTVSSMVAGSYVFELTVTDNNGAKATDEVTVTVNPAVPKVNMPPVANAGVSDTIYAPVSTYTLDASLSKDPDGTIVSYQWKQLSGPNTATASFMTTEKGSVSNLVAGVYVFQVTVTDNAGATSSATFKLTVLTNISTEAEVPDQFILYPNPAHDVVTGKLTSAITGNIKITVYDMNGKMVLTTELQKTGSTVSETLSVSMLANGMYTVQINIANRKTLVAKLVKD